MMIKRYNVTVIESTMREHLLRAGAPVRWSIVAKDMDMAWGKFCRQHFAVLKPNPADYDISLERAQRIGE